jgi:hypothetical protein
MILGLRRIVSSFQRLQRAESVLGREHVTHGYVILARAWWSSLRFPVRKRKRESKQKKEKDSNNMGKTRDQNQNFMWFRA